MLSATCSREEQVQGRSSTIWSINAIGLLATVGFRFARYTTTMSRFERTAGRWFDTLFGMRLLHIWLVRRAERVSC
jgi:hypothetical protein